MTARSASRLVRFLGLVVLTGGCAIVACMNEPAPGAALYSAPAESVVRGRRLAVTDMSPFAREKNEVKVPEPAGPDLYDPDTIPKFELTLDDAAIAILSSGVEEEKKTWARGHFKFGDVSFADVGVRVKGSSTLQWLPEKASLKVKFNKWVKGQKLNGLEEITLNNMVSDPTFIAERITYHVFRTMGLPAPKANTAQLTINGEDYGLFANVETPDENFIARAFGGKARTLYEVDWASNWVPGDEDGIEVEVPAPGASPGAMPDVDRFFEAVRAAKDETLLADIAGHLDTQQWLRFCAAEAATGHYDGYAYGVWSSHNYFMVGDADGRFSLTPWSTDLSLSDREGVPDAANPRRAVVLSRCKNGGCWDVYKNEVRSALAAFEAMDLVNLAKKWHDQIDALVRSDSKRNMSLSEYDGETAKLYKWLAARPGVVRKQLRL
jgi:CotH kinase protein